MFPDGYYWDNDIEEVVKDLKTRIFTMTDTNRSNGLGSTSDITKILNLSPGRFDDIFIPSLKTYED